MILCSSSLGLLCWVFSAAFIALPSTKNGAYEAEEGKISALSRRDAFRGAAVAGLVAVGSHEDVASASGGATAGKYTTIPSAKRRFYGRVKQAIYQFLQMEGPILTGNLQDESIGKFFDKNIIKRKGGQREAGCLEVFGSNNCVTKEKRTSRFLDFKAASDLLASAFRSSAEDVPRDLPQVKIIRACHKKITEMKTAIDEGDAAKAKLLYTKSKADLERYTKYVDLEPLASDEYTHPWDTRAEVWCQGEFCI